MCAGSVVRRSVASLPISDVYKRQLYVGGVAFAVAFTMIFAILYYVRLAPIYPEYNRDTTMYIKNISVRHEATSSESMGTLGLPFVDEFISKLHNYEYMSVMSFTMATFV